MPTAIAESDLDTPPASLVKEPSPTDLFERFLRLSIADGTASMRTIRSYREGLAIYFSWCQTASVDPATATYDHIQQYRKSLSARYKPSTCRLRLQAVRVLYQALQRWGKRADNPADGVRAPRLATTRTDATIKKSLTPAEANAFWKSLPPATTIPDARNQAIIALMLWQGLRAFEVIAIDTDHFDWVNAAWLDVVGKGRKIRRLVISDPARGAILAWTRFRGPMPGPLFYNLEHGGGMATLTVRTIERIADKALMSSGLKVPGRSAHALRHTYGVLSVLGGADREILADSLGHSSMNTTDIYIRAAGRLQANPAGAAWKACQAQDGGS